MLNDMIKNMEDDKIDDKPIPVVEQPVQQKGIELINPVKFNKKTFNDSIELSHDMATYWDLSLSFMDQGIYKEVCENKMFIEELEFLRSSNQYDVALLKFLHYLNPNISTTLRKIIEDDIKISNDESLVTKGKLKYRGGELIPNDVYNDETYVVKELPVTGATIFTQNKNKLVLGELIGDGGEGFVYKTNRRNEVVKLIKPVNEQMRKFTQNKLEQMVKMKITNSCVIWPLETVYNEENQFIGFTMNFIKGIDLKRFTASIVKNVNDTSDEININSVDKKTLCKLILSILDTIIYLHDKNIIIGDIKLENFMIKDNDLSKIYFIDCDSYQMGNFPCLLVSPGFIPPEIDNVNLGKQNCHFRTFGNENYAIFSLIFHLVFRGKPPYSQQIHDDAYISETTRVTNGMFPYFLSKSRTLQHAPKGMEEPIWAHLPSYIKKAFISVASLKGANFGEENRISPRHWKHLFTSYLADLNDSRLFIADPLCNYYHYGLKDTISYDLVDFEIPSDGIVKKGLNLEETIIQRIRNNDYIKNMIVTDNINNHDFPYITFNNKLYNNRKLFTLELIKNWNLGLEYIKNNPLSTFRISPTELVKINNYISRNRFDVALFNLIKSLNNEIFLAYDGLIFNKLDDYCNYLNEYFHFADKSIIPYEILEEVVENQYVLKFISGIYGKKEITNNDLDVMINLLTDKAIYSKGICYSTLEDYLFSIYKDELKIEPNNLLTNNVLTMFILRKNGKDPNNYDFTRTDSYHRLFFELKSGIPFKFNGNVFYSLEDIVTYCKSSSDHNEAFRNIGRWINSGILKLYSNYYPRAQRISGEVDVFQMAADNRLMDWESGHLFYLLNSVKPVYVTRDNVVIKGLKELMEILINTDNVEGFVKLLYSNCLFDVWCDLHKKR